MEVRWQRPEQHGVGVMLAYSYKLYRRRKTVGNAALRDPPWIGHNVPNPVASCALLARIDALKLARRRMTIAVSNARGLSTRRRRT